MTKTSGANLIRFTLMVIAVLIVLQQIALADPEGGQITYIGNSSKNSSQPQFRQDTKGTINTIQLNTVQQNIKWKAYIGNVSGTLVLKDSEDYSIYEWQGGRAPGGQVYMTRNATVDWSSIQCANVTPVLNEQANLGHSAIASDNINNTFSRRIHQAFQVGVTPIPGSTCKSTATWVNNTVQSLTPTSLFQEVLLMDAQSKIIYTTIIEPDTRNYKNDGRSKSDFQAILPDFTSASVTTYYFYVEISG